MNIVSVKETDQFLQINNSLKENKNFFIFIVGRWGSGKTILLNQLIDENSDKYSFHRIELGHAASFDDAIVKTIPDIFRLLIYIILVGLLALTWVIGAEYEPNQFTIKALITTFGLVFFATVLELKGIVFSIIYTIFTKAYKLTSFFFNTPKVVVIDDLERSSLTDAEIYNYLKTISKYEKRIIVVLGSNSSDKDWSYFEIASKLNASVFYKTQTISISHMLLSSVDTDKIFIREELWMAEVPFRRIQDVFRHGFLYYPADSDSRFRWIVRELYNSIIESIVRPDDLEESKNTIIIRDGPRLSHSEKMKALDTTYGGTVLNSFYSSINTEKLRKSFVGHSNLLRSLFGENYSSSLIKLSFFDLPK